MSKDPCPDGCACEWCVNARQLPNDWDGLVARWQATYQAAGVEQMQAMRGAANARAQQAAMMAQQGGQYMSMQGGITAREQIEHAAAIAMTQGGPVGEPDEDKDDELGFDELAADEDLILSLEEDIARAIFETDPRVAAFVDKVADAKMVVARTPWKDGELVTTATNETKLARVTDIAWERDEQRWRTEAERRAERIVTRLLGCLGSKRV